MLPKSHSIFPPTIICYYCNQITFFIVHLSINTLITNEKNFFNLQLLLMSGIKLNNVPLMEYAIEFDKNIVHTPVPSNVTNLIDNIFNNEESQNTEDISPQ